MNTRLELSYNCLQVPNKLYKAHPWQGKNSLTPKSLIQSLVLIPALQDSPARKDHSDRKGGHIPKICSISCDRYVCKFMLSGLFFAMISYLALIIEHSEFKEVRFN